VAKYSDRLLNIIPACPEYAKLEDLVEIIAVEAGEPACRVREAVKKDLQRWATGGIVARHPQLPGYYCRKAVSSTAVLEEALEKAGDSACLYEVRPPVVKVVILHARGGRVEPELVSVPVSEVTPQLWGKLREKCVPVDPNK
jgi:hypothetical protein